MSSIKIKISAAVLLFFVGLFFLEIFSIITFSAYHYVVKGLSANELKNTIINRYKTIYNSEVITEIGDYDPVTQMQFPGNFEANNFLKTNSYGYLGNSNAINPLNTFPEKKEREFRVIMMGGSSMFGFGVNHESKTIPSYLERLSNSEINKIKSKYDYIQVLNFGHPGAHSSILLMKLSQYLVHLEPDMVISLDGFNDAWYALFEHKRQSGNFEHGVINWSDYSYFLHECINYGCRMNANQFGIIAKILPFTTTIVSSFSNKIKGRNKNLKKKMENYPPLKISKYIFEKDEGLHEAFIKNYAATAGLACANDFFFVGILQPHAFESINTLSPSELEKLKKWEERYGSYTGNAIGYEEQMRKIYNKYQEDLVELNNKLDWCEKVSFISFRDIFNFNHQEDFFEDNIHYTEAGNKFISKEIMPFLEKAYKD